MVRIAYFGTNGCPGHHVIPIRGKFTEEDVKVIESVDCDDFYKVFDVMRFKIAEFKGWTILGIPASLDDHRPGSKTFFDVYDRDEMKLIYGIKISILKEMFGICI